MYNIEKKKGATAKYCKEIVLRAMWDVLKTNVRELTLFILCSYVSYKSVCLGFTKKIMLLTEAIGIESQSNKFLELEPFKMAGKN